jgi:16S rRNA (cytidine1402-2'-O)-methyltransferase
VLPGANALLPALLLSGIAPDPFFFAGFLRGGERERRTRLTELSGIGATLVFYVAPHDLKRDAALMVSILGDRAAALVREISKAHQETARGTMEEIARAASEREMRGEMAIVIEGAPETPREERTDEWIGLAARMKAAGIFDREIVSVLSASYGIPRNRIKESLLKLKAETGGSA